MMRRSDSDGQLQSVAATILACWWVMNLMVSLLYPTEIGGTSGCISNQQENRRDQEVS